MITFSKYQDIVQSISKKLKVSKDQAVNALIKAQQKGIDPLEWQKHITMLKQFVQIVAHKEDTQKEFFTLGVNKPTKDQIQDYLDRLGNAVRLLSNKDIIRTVERYFKTIKNLKLDRSGRKVLSFEEVEIENHEKEGGYMDKKTYNQFMKEAEEDFTDMEDLDEKLSPSQRRKMALRMRIQAKKPAFIMKRKRMMKRAANKQTLQRRARKAAIKRVVKKFYPKLRGKKTSDLSYAERGKISDIVKKKAAIITRFAKRMIKDVRKKDVERRKSMNKNKNKK